MPKAERRRGGVWRSELKILLTHDQYAWLAQRGEAAGGWSVPWAIRNCVDAMRLAPPPKDAKGA
jgi:hypothetical protein